MAIYGGNEGGERIDYNRVMKRIAWLVAVGWLMAGKGGMAAENRYATIVLPVRERSLWKEKTVEPLKKQYEMIKEKEMAATWLWQYETLEDEELMGEARKFNEKQEAGIWLEIGKNLTDRARVRYPTEKSWYDPGVVFLSGYERGERKRLIDEMWRKFRERFGRYPDSAGAWWVDSYSLEYIKEKYGLKTVMIVADQKTTDGYGVWGQWWGVPYIPERSNILVPAKDGKGAGVTVIQWALRDPEMAAGEGKASLYSMQANDYLQVGKDDKYFEKLMGIYLDNQNELGQITVGLETGMESIGREEEFEKQLERVKEKKGLEVVTMGQFGETFEKKPLSKAKIGNWVMTTEKRSNQKLGEEIDYRQGIAWGDYFVADRSSFLNRVLAINSRQKNRPYPPYWIGVAAIGLMVGIIKKEWRWGVIGGIAGAGLCFGPLLKSYYQFGWKIYFGPVVENLELAQMGVLAAGVVTGIVMKKIRFLPLVFGWQWLLERGRISLIEEKYYAGILADAFRFIGASLTKKWEVAWVNKDLPGYVAGSMLKLEMGKIWDNRWMTWVGYPIAVVVAAIVIGWVIEKLPKRWRWAVVAAMGLVTIGGMISLGKMDPREVRVWL